MSFYYLILVIQAVMVMDGWVLANSNMEIVINEDNLRISLKSL